MTYTSKAVTNRIVATSRVAVKIKDNYYTIEYLEERSIPDNPDIDLDKERLLLFDAVNNTVDTQIADIVKSFKK